jgi:antirestriction protein ArdC
MTTYSGQATPVKENPKPAADWSRLLAEAVARPGVLSAAYRAFHNYSFGNQILALVQCETRGLQPGPIATFRGWQDKGRCVRRGERALWLCMPVTVKRERDESGEPAAITAFVYKPRWFVLAQTEGEPVAPTPTPGWDRALALSNLGVTEIPFDHTDGNCQGFARGRSIAVSPVAALPHKTTFHELAHVTLGHTTEHAFSDGANTPRNLREAEAEAVALILCESLGLPGADEARGYIQHWLRADVIPDRSAQKIFGAADRILRAGAAGGPRTTKEDQDCGTD